MNGTGDRATARNRSMDSLHFAVALLGASICLFLSYLKFSGGGDGLAGCGAGGCSEVLSSRWSMVFGVPVSLLGLGVYCGLVVSMFGRARAVHVPLLGVLAGSVCWFVIVQALLLREFCPWCMAAHGVALVAVCIGIQRGRKARDHGVARRIFFWCAVSFFSIALAQLYGPRPASHRITAVDVSSVPAPVHERGEGRVIAFDGGRKTFKIQGLPLLGRPDAKNIVVEYFDYQCAACQTMSGFLGALVEKHPEEVAVILLPVPLEEGCNPGLPLGGGHPGSCEITRIALGVWRAEPGAFPAFHRELMARPSVAEARRLASGITAARDASVLSPDGWVDELIAANIADWKVLSGSSSKLPKLLIRDRRILHGLPSGKDDFIRVLEKELGIDP